MPSGRRRKPKSAAAPGAAAAEDAEEAGADGDESQSRQISSEGGESAKQGGESSKAEGSGADEGDVKKEDSRTEVWRKTIYQAPSERLSVLTTGTEVSQINEPTQADAEEVKVGTNEEPPAEADDGYPGAATDAAANEAPGDTPVSSPEKAPPAIEPAGELQTTPPSSPEKPEEAAPAPAAPAPAEPSASSAAAPTVPVESSSHNSLAAAAEKRLRELLPQVTDDSVLQWLADLPDAEALKRLVERGKPPPAKKTTWQSQASVASSATSAVERKDTTGSFSGNFFAVSDGMKKAQDSQQAAKSQAKNFGNVDSKSLAVGGAGQGGGLGLNKPGFGPKVTHFAGGRSSVGGKSISIDEDVPVAWSEMQDDKSSVGWVIAAYSSDGKSLTLQGKGEGGLSNFKSNLPEGLAWGGFRCYGVDRRGGVECKRPKFVFVQYKPETASAMKKAKQGANKGDVKESFPGAHLDIVVESMKDLDEQDLITKMQAATGAHKPNGYEFDEGVFVEADFYGLGIGKNCKGETVKN